MKGASSSLYESVDPAEVDAARTMRFDDGFYENRYSRKAEAWRIRHCLPIDAQAYCALVLPWRAQVKAASGWHDVRDYPFDGISEAYAYLGKPVPSPLTLDSWHADFRVTEDVRVVPPLARSALDQFSRTTDVVFIRCHHDGDIHNWKIERALFLELPDPFTEMPQPFGSFGIFPRGGPWYLHHRHDEPVIYVGGPSALVSRLEQTCSGRLVRLTLDDYYF